MDVREKLIEILRKPIFPHELVAPTEAVAYEWGQRTNSFGWTMEWLQQPAKGE